MSPTPAFPRPVRQEPELIPYQACAVPAGPLLVLAPHPDDEVFGCGGLLALAVAQGVRVRVIVVSDGAAGGDAAAREQECRAAAHNIGYLSDSDALQFWRLPDRGVLADAALVQRIVQQCRLFQPGWLLAPSPFEVHPDHRAVCQAAVAAVQAVQAVGAATLATELVFYEVGHPLPPNRLVDISAVTPVKRAAMHCFASQLAVQDYGEHVLALNRYRSYTLGPAVTHAEAFWAWPGAALAGAADTRGLGAVVADVARQLADRFEPAATVTTTAAAPPRG